MRPASLALLLAVLAACPAHKSAGERLALAQRDVLDALQFGDYDVAARYVRPEKRADFLSRAYGARKTLHVLELSTVSVDAFEDHARSVARVSWYELPSTVVKEDTVFFDWIRSGEGWAIDTIVGGPLQLQ